MKKKYVSVPVYIGNNLVIGMAMIVHGEVMGVVITKPGIIVQTRNPRTNRYVKIDRAKGAIIGHKRTPGPYKNISIVEDKV